MNSSNKLDFLEFLTKSREIQYKTSKWLQSDFEDDIWNFEFNDKNSSNFSIDFNIEFHDGSYLSDSQNRRLLNVFKYWINCVNHADNTSGKGLSYSCATVRTNIIYVLSIIDYLLLNSKSLNLTSIGLEGISDDNMRELLSEFSSSNHKAISIYKWPERLSEFLMSEVSKSDINALQAIIETSKFDITTITQDQIDDDFLKIPYEYIPLIRAWLISNNLTSKRAKNGTLIPKATSLAALIYRNTLFGGKGFHLMPKILCVDFKDVYKREYPSIEVSNRRLALAADAVIGNYKLALRALRLLYDPDLAHEKLPLPHLDTLNIVDIYKTDTKKAGRFRTIPSNIVFGAVKEAIEFHIKYGESLVLSYRNLLTYIQKFEADTGETFALTDISEKDFSNLMTSDLKSIGVKKWSLMHHKNYYFALRSNVSLGPLIKVYYGAVSVVVGAIMARRSGEYANLISGECLDKFGKYLLFSKHKSTRNLNGIRENVARPIDDIAVEMIRQIDKFQDIWIDFGIINEKTNLFSTVYETNPRKISKMDLDTIQRDCMSIFCDYVQTPVENGKRYYIRHHQLRRFFAMSFFWGNGFGGLDTLRWFLGHTNAEHLYHYITESCDGKILNSVKAQYATETIKSHENLQDLIKIKYGTDDFTLVESEDLQEYINELLEEGIVEIEPEFLTDIDKNSYRILVKINKNGM